MTAAGGGASAPCATSATLSPIVEGSVSGTIPTDEAFAVHYPGYPSSPSRAFRTLGGLSEIAKVRTSESRNLELRFRPEDPYCHPTFGEIRPASGLLMRIVKTTTKGEAEVLLSAEVVARVNQSYHFEGMVDYQHILPVHAAEARKKKRQRLSKDSSMHENQESIDMDGGDVMMLVPPLFSNKNVPTELVLDPSAEVYFKKMQRAIVEHKWEMDIEPALALPFDIEVVPTKTDWEAHISKSHPMWKAQMAVCKLFDDRPIWPRRSIEDCLSDDGLQLSHFQLTRLLFRVGYYFSTGPFGQFWIGRDYDPRKDPESRKWQRVDFRLPSELRKLGTMNGIRRKEWRDVCQFRVIPKQSFTSLQLFELDDDFIQDEIKKPSHQRTCSHSTGWFSEPMLRMLRLQVGIRFFLLYPSEATEDLLKNARVLLERLKKKEALCRCQKLEKEDLQTNKDSDQVPDEPSSDSTEPEDDEAIENSETEVEDEDVDEREDIEAYESNAMVSGSTFPLAGYYDNLEENSPSNFLQELLQGFPMDGHAGADSIDGEFGIYEHDSDDSQD